MYLLENENDKRNETYAGPNTTSTQAYKCACYTPTSRVFKRNMIHEKHKKVVYFGIREESWNVRVLIHPQPPTEYAKKGRTFSVRGDAYRIPHIFVSIRARIRQKCPSRGSNTDLSTWECPKVFEPLGNASVQRWSKRTVRDHQLAVCISNSSTYSRV